MARHMAEIASASPAGETIEEQRIVELGAGVLLCRKPRLCAVPHGMGRAGRGWPQLGAALGYGLPLEEASDRRLSPLVPDTGAGHRTHPLVIAMAGHAARTTYSPTDISPSALEENRRY